VYLITWEIKIHGRKTKMFLQEGRWKRRGHTRKPNFVVRSIYAVADWIGDFRPLFSSAKRGAGLLTAFAGHSLLLLVTLSITLLLVVTSAIHSFELLNWIGFYGWTIYPILIVVEVIFLTGSIQMDLSLKNGVSLFGKYFKPSPPIFGFVVGLIFVLASNIMGLADNLGGLIFGFATPFLLIISKAMLAWQYTFKTKVAPKSIEENKPLPENQTPELPQTTKISEVEKLILKGLN
jgi:hypothetical protein